MTENKQILSTAIMKNILVEAALLFMSKTGGWGGKEGPERDKEGAIKGIKEGL